MVGESQGLRLPYLPAQQACYDRVREVAPSLWSALEGELAERAASAAPIEARVRDLLEAEDRLWAEFTAGEGGARGAVALGRSWHCSVEDLIGAIVETAAAEIAGGDGPADERRERLQGLFDMLRAARPESFSVATVGMDLRAAIAELAA
jgi:hypothetical protein